MSQRIVVTGMGMVSPLGCGVETAWTRLLAGRSGIRRLPDEVVADLPAKVAGVVPAKSEDDEGGFDADAAVERKDQKKMDRFIQFAMLAADEALRMSGWAPEGIGEQERTATIIASGIGGFPAIADAVRTVGDKGPRRLVALHRPVFLVNLAAGQVSIKHVSRPDRLAGHGLRGERPGHRRCGAADPRR